MIAGAIAGLRSAFTKWSTNSNSSLLVTRMSTMNKRSSAVTDLTIPIGVPVGMVCENMLCF